MLEHQDEAHKLCMILSDLNFNGHKSIVTPQSFARPNFKLVCQLLDWFARILHPDASNTRVPLESLRCDKYRPNDVPEIIHIDNLKKLAKEFNQILGVRLQLLRLYRSDWSCCPELLKVASPIYEAAKLFMSERSELLNDPKWSETQTSTREVHLKKLRDIVENFNHSSKPVQKMSERVAELERMLGEEDRYHGERQAVIGRRLEVGQVQRVLDESQASLRATADRHRKQNDELHLDLRRLDEKLSLKESEISEAKLKADDHILLQSPVYLDKQHKLRQEYDTAYQRFVSTYRTLTHLKMCLDDDQEINDDEQKPVTNSGFRKLFPTDIVDELEKPCEQIEILTIERSELIIVDVCNAPVQRLESLFNANETSKTERFDIKQMRSAQIQGPSLVERLNGLDEAGKRDPGSELDALLDEFDVAGPSNLLPANENQDGKKEEEEEEDDDDETVDSELTEEGDEEEEEKRDDSAEA